MHLSPDEMRELIARYESELRKLEYQTDKTRNTIADLRTQIEQALGKNSSIAPLRPKKGPGRKKNVESPEVEMPEAKPLEESAPDVIAPEVEVPETEAAETEVPEAETPTSGAENEPAPEEDTTSAENAGMETPAKRKPGRPRRNPEAEASDEPKPKGKPGRPRKNPPNEAAADADAKPIDQEQSATTFDWSGDQDVNAQSETSDMESGNEDSKPKSSRSRILTPKKKEGPKVAEFAGSSDPDRLNGRMKLSDWDEFIFATLNKSGQPMTASDFAKIALDTGFSDDLADIKVKLNRSLTKLASRRSDLVKLPFDGRGFSYSLPSWVDNAGNLKK